MINVVNLPSAKTNISRRMCSNQERKEYLKKMCEVWGSPEVGDKRLLVDEKYRLMQCSIPKAAATTWKALWETANKHKHKHPEQYFKSESKFTNVIHGDAFKKAGLKLVDVKYKDKYSEYTKFLSLRNPFDRIYSAYSFFRNRPGFIGKYLKRVNVNHWHSKAIKFQHFLEIILNNTSDREQLKYKNDRHWQPMSYLCDICHIDYDYILRIESLSYDSGPILKKLGYPEDFLLAEKINLNRHSTNNNTHTASHDTADNQVITIKPKYLKVYKEIPKLLYDKFVKRFRFDLHLCGYNFDFDTAKTECNVHVPSGEVCC